MKILFIAPYPTEGASTRYRVSQFFPYLESRGIACELRPFFSAGFFRILYRKGKGFRKGCYFVQSCFGRVLDFFRGLQADLIFIHLEAFPFGPPILEWAWSKCGKRIVYDLDDAIYLSHASEANRRYRWLKWPSKIPKIIQLSREVITCNEYLAAYVRQFNKRVHILSTSLDMIRFRPPASRDAARKVVIGWIGSHSTAPFLEPLRGVFQALAKRYDFTLKIVGAGYSVVLPGVDIIQKEWSLERDVQEFQELDIGVYPLPETEWVFGKTGFKTAQYMATGVACVASRIGRNNDIIQHGESGFLAKTEQEWIEALSRLLESPSLRQTIGQAGRRRVEVAYSLQKNQSVFCDIVEQILLGRQEGGRKKRIFHLITDLDIGGTPTALSSILAHIDRQRYDVTVCSLKQKGTTSVSDEIQKLGIPVFFLDAERLLFFAVLYRLYLLLKDEQPSILHTWLFHANVFGRLAGRLAGVSTIISSERSVNREKGLFRIWADRLTSVWADFITVNAEAVKEVLVLREKISPSKVSVIQSGIDLAKFSDRTLNGTLREELGLGAGDLVVLNIARLDPIKGHEDLLFAMRQVVQKIPSARLVLVGEGPCRNKIEQRIRSLGMTHAVKMLGIRRDIAEILHLSDLFVLPSWEEGMPLSLLEAMGMGRAVIATDVGGVREVIEDDSLGVVVSARKPEVLGQEITRLLLDPKQRKEIGQNARRHVEGFFDIARTVGELEQTYRRAVALGHQKK